MIQRVCRIENHPIKKLPESIKEKYLRGLACVLFNITNGNPNMKMIFEQWAISIMGKDMSHLFTQQDESCIKKALTLNRIGFHFFRCKHEFYFDCYYLLVAYSVTTDADYDDFWAPQLTAYLENVGRNIHTKKTLQATNNAFLGQQSITIDDSLAKHMTLNESFEALLDITILVVATVSAGKSTLINAMIGYDFNTAKTTACTNSLSYIFNKPVDDGITYWDGTYYKYSPSLDAINSEETSWAGLHFKSLLGEHNICLIDTPGVNNSMDTDHWAVTRDAIKEGNYDAVLFISNSQYNGTSDERSILEYLYANCDKPVIVALNQLDRFKSSEDSIQKMIDATSIELKRIGFKYPEIYPVTALYALLLRQEDSLDEEEKEDLEILRRRFAKDYYDLPKYIGLPSVSEIDRTGITCLENAIINKFNLND